MINFSIIYQPLKLPLVDSNLPLVDSNLHFIEKICLCGKPRHIFVETIIS